MDSKRKLPTVNSLLNIVLKYVIDNLSIYEKSELESLELLPFMVKNKLLRRFTTNSYYSRNVIFEKFLKAFANKMTSHIDLTSISVTDEMLHILRTCENLKSLYLTRDGNNCSFSTEGLINLLQTTTRLENLIIMKSQYVSDEVLKTISINCQCLQGLDIGGCVNVSDKGLKLLSNMQLKWLRISFTQVTDEGITALVEGKCGKTLTEFILNNCVHVTDIGLNKINQCCQNLTILNFLDCSIDLSTTVEFMYSKPLKQLFWQIPF